MEITPDIQTQSEIKDLKQITKEFIDINEDEKISITTFNILCPLYFKTTGTLKKVGKLESNLGKKEYETRHEIIAKFLLHINSDLVALQEVWLPTANMDKKRGVLDVFDKYLGHIYGFVFHQRTNMKEDGVLILYRKSKFKLINKRPVEFGGLLNYNRIGLITHLEYYYHRDLTKENSVDANLLAYGEKLSIIFTTTHLLFPSLALDLRTRNDQVRRLAEAINGFIADENVAGNNISFITGDFNSDMAAKNIRNTKQSTLFRGFKEAFLGSNWMKELSKHGYVASQSQNLASMAAAFQKFVSHCAHTNQLLDCDYIFFRSDIAQNSKFSDVSIRHSKSNLDELVNEVLMDLEANQNQSTPIKSTASKYSRTGKRMSPKATDSELKDPGSNANLFRREMKAEYEYDMRYNEEKKCQLESDLDIMRTRLVPRNADMARIQNQHHSVKSVSSQQSISSKASISSISKSPSFFLGRFRNRQSGSFSSLFSFASNRHFSKKPNKPANLSLDPQAQIKTNSSLNFLNSKKLSVSSINPKSRLKNKQNSSNEFNQFKFNIVEVLACYLEPKHIRGDLKLLRPKTEAESILYDVFVNERMKKVMKEIENDMEKLVEKELDQDELEELFLKHWRKISDHRPKTAVFKILPKL